MIYKQNENINKEKLIKGAKEILELKSKTTTTTKPMK